MFTFSVLTISDKGYIGERIDQTGPDLVAYLQNKNFKNVFYDIIPDNFDMICEKIIKIADELKPNLIFTNGGTGFSQRDITPEATRKVIQREIPGIPEVMRQESLKITPRAMLSRAVAGIRNNTIIINLPGSPKAAVENLSYIIDTLPHGIEILMGSANECARVDK